MMLKRLVLKVISNVYASCDCLRENLKLYIFDVEKVGQGHGGENRYLRRSIANV